MIKAALRIMIHMSDWIFYVIGWLLLLVTALSFYMEIESGIGIRRMIIGSGVFFLIPQAAVMLEAALEICTNNISSRIGGNYNEMRR